MARKPASRAFLHARDAAQVTAAYELVGGSADASLNLGALPAVGPGEPLRAAVPKLTGARCNAGLLHVSIPWSERHGFADVLTLLGSYHIFDYNLFYLNIRSNAAERVAAYRTAAGAAP